MSEEYQKFMEETERIAQKAETALGINIYEYYSLPRKAFRCPSCPLSLPNASDFIRHIIQSHYDSWMRKPDIVAIFFNENI